MITGLFLTARGRGPSAVSPLGAPERTCPHGKTHAGEVPSAGHVQTRPAFQDLSANVLSPLNQLDPSGRGARRRHRSNPPRRVRNTMSLAAAQKCLRPALKAARAPSAGQPRAPTCTAPEQTVVKQPFTAAAEGSPTPPSERRGRFNLDPEPWWLPSCSQDESLTENHHPSGAPRPSGDRKLNLGSFLDPV